MTSEPPRMHCVFHRRRCIGMLMPSRRDVTAYNSDGKMLGTFPSATEAAEEIRRRGVIDESGDP